MKDLLENLQNKNVIVTLCCHMPDAYDECISVYETLMRSGILTIKPNVYTTFQMTDTAKSNLLDTHKKAISISTFVLVIGDSLAIMSRQEIDYAFSLGIPVYVTGVNVDEFKDSKYYQDNNDRYCLLGLDLFSIKRKSSENSNDLDIRLLVESGTECNVMEFYKFIRDLSGDTDINLGLFDIGKDDLNYDYFPNDHLIIYNINEDTQNPFVLNNIIRLLSNGRKVFSTLPFRAMDKVSNKPAQLCTSEKSIMLYQLILEED